MKLTPANPAATATPAAPRHAGRPPGALRPETLTLISFPVGAAIATGTGVPLLRTLAKEFPVFASPDSRLKKINDHVANGGEINNQFLMDLMRPERHEKMSLAALAEHDAGQTIELGMGELKAWLLMLQESIWKKLLEMDPRVQALRAAEKAAAEKAAAESEALRKEGEETAPNVTPAENDDDENDDDSDDDDSDDDENDDDSDDDENDDDSDDDDSDDDENDDENAAA